jgi:cyanophycinase-like exopeptidase
VVALAPRRLGRSLPEAVLVELGWKTRRTTAEGRRRLAERWTSIGAHGVDSGLVDRLDAESTEACERLADADLVWLGGGDAAPIYDRLWATPALDAIRHAHDNGAVVGGISAGARVWGRGTLSDFASLGEPEPFPLFGWLEDLVIFNHYFPTREQAFRRHLAAFPGCCGLAIAHGGAVLVDPSSLDICVLRSGLTGTPHVQLAGPDQPLSVVKG